MPLASHSRVIVEPFLTTNLPSCGKGCTLGGTENKKLSKNIFSTNQSKKGMPFLTTCNLVVKVAHTLTKKKKIKQLF